MFHKNILFFGILVSSETSTPDEEQLPVLSEIKENASKTETEVLMDDGMQESPGESSLNDNVTLLEMSPGESKDGEGHLISVDSSLDGLSQGTMRLQEISPEQVLAQGHLGFTVSEGELKEKKNETFTHFPVVFSKAFFFEKANLCTIDFIQLEFLLLQSEKAQSYLFDID